jgi:hypothetical protein
MGGGIRQMNVLLPGDNQALNSRTGPEKMQNFSKVSVFYTLNILIYMIL